MDSMLEVIEVSGFATVQDEGRKGLRRFGVPSSGPMDGFAFRAANRLAGNAPCAAALEIGSGDIVLRAMYDCVIAVAGAGHSLTVSIWDFSPWSSCLVRSGWTIRLSQSGSGLWSYLALAGGVEVPPVMGSRSTYLRGHFGGLEGRLLQPGDVLRRGRSSPRLLDQPVRTLAEEARPAYSKTPTLEVIPGPQTEYFDQESLNTFLSKPYKVSLSSDRMGYRLEGPRLSLPGGADITSEGQTAGAVQVPANGQPIVMMADCATAGGYPKIASVITADLPLLAQCAPGRDEVRFKVTTVEAAQEKYRRQINKLETGILKAEDDLNFTVAA
jgi:antagonist of KipI